MTSWGISKPLTANLQDSGIFPSQVPSSSLCFLFHNPRKPEQPEGLTQLYSPCPPPLRPGTTFSFLPLGLATLSRPQLSPAPDFPVPGSGRAWPWVWWSEPWLAVLVGLAFPAAFLCGPAALGLAWSEAGERCSVLSRVAHLGAPVPSSDLRGGRGLREDGDSCARVCVMEPGKCRGLGVEWMGPSLGDLTFWIPGVAEKQQSPLLCWPVCVWGP